jgi:hypothetical protein
MSSRSGYGVPSRVQRILRLFDDKTMHEDLVRRGTGLEGGLTWDAGATRIFAAKGW